VKLIKTEPNQNFDLARYVSENGEWEMGLRSTIYGVRVCGNRVGSFAHVFTYCAGADRGFISILLLVMISILQGLPESISERELERMLPSYKVKPKFDN
jgi:hypothetical protein